MTMELLDSECEEHETPAETEKREEYVDKYVNEMDSIPGELKDRLSRKPVFLPRCVRGYMDKSKNIQNQDRSITAASISGNNSPSSSNELKDAENKRLVYANYYCVFAAVNQCQLQNEYSVSGYFLNYISSCQGLKLDYMFQISHKNCHQVALITNNTSCERTEGGGRRRQSLFVIKTT
jgi:hypothetical protein